MIEAVYQCGHCGVVFPDKISANECCGGFAELGYQCRDCGRLYNTNLQWGGKGCNLEIPGAVE